MERQLGYLEEQRSELQRVVEEAGVRGGEWREKEAQRKWLRKQLDELQEAQQQHAQQLVTQQHTTPHTPSHCYSRTPIQCGLHLVSASCPSLLLSSVDFLSFTARQGRRSQLRGA